MKPKYKLIINPRFTVYIKSEAALSDWKIKFPYAQVVELD